MRKLLFIIIIMGLFIFGCTSDSRTINTLQRAGFTDIQTTGYSFFACSEDDTFSTGFTATNPGGDRVSGTVCCGLMKDCTIRY